MSTRGSSPIKPFRATHAIPIPHEVRTFVFPDHEEELTLAAFWEMLDYSPEDFKGYDLSDHWCPKEDFKNYMNEISKSILQSFPDLHHDRLIIFHDTSTISTLDVSTGTPDFVACPKTQKKIRWAEIEATVEIHSADSAEEDATDEGPRHAGSYTLYQLQARPDRVSVQGFYADANGVVLIISNADGVKKSPKLNLKDAEQYQLIYAFVKRLYDPHPSTIDPTVKRRREQNSRWVFDIMLAIPNSPSSVECVGYKIKRAMEPVGRRTHIFMNDVNPTLLNGVAITAIKDQYCLRDHRFNEAEVLRHVHADEEIPGIVRMAHSEDVIRSDGTPVCSDGRQKRRIGLVEFGEPFMDLETPLEALKAIFDLLETTRRLYFQRNILHGNINYGNIVYKEGSPTATTLTKNTSQEHKFCFIEHLLDPNVAPSATVNLLFNFDRDEICNMKEDGRRLERMPICMARAVRKGQPLGYVGNLACYNKMPELSQKAHVYEDVFPDRLTRFQYGPEWHMATVGVPPESSSWHHELRHDAESAFWLLVWWAVNAAPADEYTSKIPIGFWMRLTGTTSDTRPLDISSSYLEPAYAPLSKLLRQLGDALEDGDLHWATDTPFTYPDFLHEVFQRHILNFIFENRDKDFMNLVKAYAPRKPEELLLCCLPY